MTRPLFEPTLTREVATNKWGDQQLFRRPAVHPQMAKYSFTDIAGQQPSSWPGGSFVPWDTFRTTDPVTFHSAADGSPSVISDTAGDTYFYLSSPGFYWLQATADWEEGDYMRYIFANVPDQWQSAYGLLTTTEGTVISAFPGTQVGITLQLTALGYVEGVAWGRLECFDFSLVDHLVFSVLH